MNHASIAAIVTAACSVGAASATPTFFPALNNPSTSPLQTRDMNRLAARYRADTTNWNSRLEFDTMPNNGDQTANAGNGASRYADQTFSFTLSYDAGTGDSTWSVSGSAAGANPTSITQSMTGFTRLNLFQISTSGRSGPTTVTNLMFDTVGTANDVASSAFPNIDTQLNANGGPEFAETFLFFGDNYNLLDNSWTLSGDLTFGSFNRSNPSERNKIDITVRDAVPTPASAALLGMSGLAALRRRR